MNMVLDKLIIREKNWFLKAVSITAVCLNEINVMSLYLKAVGWFS